MDLIQVKSSHYISQHASAAALCNVCFQVPAAVQEEVVFDDLEAAVQSCFKGVRTQTHTWLWLAIVMVNMLCVFIGVDPNGEQASSVVMAAE